MPLSVGADGWCAGVAHYPTPHCDARPAGTEIDLLVIHNISLPAGRFQGPHVSDLFTGRLDFHADPSFEGLRGLRVSAHFFVRRDGAIIQYVPTGARAWHAGASHFRGRDRCNDFSIGIELEGSDFIAFTAAQYGALAQLTAALRRRYRLAAVCGHQHIAPGRKTDPGPLFDWAQYRAALAKQAPAGPALHFPPLA